MDDFGGRIAVITGGGAGMGRELARQLVAEGCHVAICDVSEQNLAAAAADCVGQAAQGARVFAHAADVADEGALEAFRDRLAEAFETDRIHLLVNNAGIGGGGGFVAGDRAGWERTFNICWGGVYNGCRVFLPMLLRADAGHIVNTSSVNGFWASLGPNTPHTAYAAAKFAVKGFTEALVTDLRINAPHVLCSVVMPGHVGTDIIANSRKVLTRRDTDRLGPGAIAQARARFGAEAAGLTDAEVQARMTASESRFRDAAPTSAATAARIILDGVRARRWRILVGEDAEQLDAMVRRDPEGAYEPAFWDRFVGETGWAVGG